MSSTDETERFYTPWQYQRAVRARALLHAAGHPSVDDLKKVLEYKLIPDCPVTAQDLKVAENIMGPDVSTLKGKSVRRKPKGQVQADLVTIPPELLQLHKEVTLCVDVMHVCEIPFLVTIVANIQYRTCKALTQKKGMKKTDVFLFQIESVVALLKKGGFKVTVIKADEEFETLLEPLSPIELNIASAGEHVPEIERNNRTCKERVRAGWHRMPHKSLPACPLIAQVEATVHALNYFPLKNGVSDQLSPRTIVERKTISYEKHLKHCFGDYVLASMPTTNTPKQHFKCFS